MKWGCEVEGLLPEHGLILARFFGWSEEVGDCQEWVFYRRRGKVFALERIVGGMGLRLYQPQRFWSRRWKDVVGWGRYLGWPLGGKRKWLREGQGSLIKGLEELVGGVVQEVCLGNLSHGDKRLVLFLGRAEGGLVVKLGIDERARESFQREVRVMRELGLREESRVPEVLVEGEVGPAFFMGLPFYGETWKWDDERLAGLLLDWIAEEGVVVSETDEWGEALEFLDELGVEEWVLRRMGGIVCSAGVVHGDLAPWNVRDDGFGNPVVIDWENGRVRGVAGFDLVHWFFQGAYYVSRKELRGCVEVVLEHLKGEVFGGYVKAAGWAGDEVWLVIFYLASGALIPRGEREELVRVLLLESQG